MQDKVAKNKVVNGSVCFLTTDLTIGGTERVIVTLANELILSGRDVTIATLGKKNDFSNFLNPKVKIISLNCENIRYLPIALLNFFFKNSFDNVLVNLWPITSLGFLVKFFKPRTNLVLIEHCPLSEQFKNRGVFFKLSLKFSIKAFYRFANTIVSVSSGVKQDLLTLGAPENKIKVIYNPFHQNFLKSNEIKDQKILEWLQASEINLISVGVLKESKNFINLVKSLDILKNHFKKEIKLLILGDGNERSKIQNCIDDHNLQDSILLAGWVADPIMFMKLSDLFVLSSDYEGFGVVIIEALSVGLNVVSTNSTGPAEILKNGELGILCPINNPLAMAESIIKALTHPVQREELIGRAAEFTPQKIIQDYEKILN
jgi:glycosyltransferase involved in cell wall biosynthesis